MTQITDIIKIDISRETQAVSQTNFNIPLFLATFTNFAERAREYASLADVAGDFACNGLRAHLLTDVGEYVREIQGHEL